MRRQSVQKEKKQFLAMQIMKRQLNRIYAMLAAMLITVESFALPASDYTGKSVLAEGRWVKISVVTSGIYQITHSELQSWGFNPSKVKIYGYGGEMLSEKFSDPYIDDLPQIPVLRTGDRILFYAQGTVLWENSGNGFTHTQNCYATAGYYFITENDEPVATIQQKDDNAARQATTTTLFDDYALYENELYNIGNMGRNLYGEDFVYTTTRDFTFDIPGISGDVTMQVDFVAKLATSAKLTIKHNGTDLTAGDANNISAFGSSDDWYYTAGKLTTIKKTFTPDPSAPDVITLQLKATSPVTARLDYIKLQMKRELKLYGGAVKFRSLNASNSYIRYNIDVTGYNNVHIWDVSEHHSPVEINAAREGNTLSFTPQTLGVHEYAAFDENVQYPSPAYIGEVANQNLHGLERADLVIICPSQFYSQAKRLAEFHLEHDNISSIIVSPELIYNEFSSGKPDATAYRRFMKMFYDRAESAGDATLYPRYLLLFGDGSCDNRHITEQWKGYNYPFLLTFQSKESLDERSGYVTDDYFAFLKDSDGTNLLSDKPVIGVGRFPVRTVTEATVAVDKLINYSTSSDYGIWKNDICLVADDGNASEHMKQCDDLADIINTGHPEFLPSKIYIDAYTKQGASSGGTYPEAKEDMLRQLDNGVLILNYVGHGSANGWTDEKMLTMQDIKKMYLKRLPLFITATCDFSRFDALTNSGGEELFLNSKGGGIALISTSRVVYISKNGTYNKMLITHIFDRDENGERYRLGDAMRLSKSAVTDYYGSDMNKLNFILLGDPALQLAFPGYKIKVTEINGKAVTGNPEDIEMQARAEITVKGIILDEEGNKDETFNGTIEQRLYDSETEITTHGNGDAGEPYTFKRRTNKLYSGSDKVENGEFTFTFKMPKELNYTDEPGLLNMYAYDTSRGIEAHGTSQDFIVNGMDTEAEADTEGPTIESFYLNTSAFSYGATINETPVFFAQVYDKSGINVSGIGLGHDMTIKIDNSSAMEYVVNDYFTSSPGDFGRGTVQYQLPALSAGEHTLTFKVWDTEGNSSEKSTMFKVDTGQEPDIIMLYTDKNPVKEQANFYIRHDRPDMIMDVKITVYDLTGTQLWSTQAESVSDKWTTEPVTWNLTDASGKRVPPGIYIYKAEANTEGSRISSESKKIVVLAQ